MSARTKRLFSFLFIVLMLITLASCRSAAPGNSEPTQTAPTDAAPVLPGKLVLNAKCTVTYPAANSELKAAADALTAYVNTVIPDAKLTAASSSDNVSTEYTIAICEPDSSLASSYAVKLDGKVIKLCGKEAAAVLDAVNYFKAFCISGGYFAVDEKLNFASAAGPVVLSQHPEKYYYYEDIYTPSLAYTFDASTVDTAKSRLFISGEDVTGKAVWGKDSVTFTGHTVDAGDHTVLLVLTGTNGEVEVFETAFSCGEGSVMHLYSGEVHAHTSDSDGKGTIEEAYAYARDSARLDFFAVTDHSDSFPNSLYQGSHLPNADSFNDPGNFAALYGYEQTYNLHTGFYGHLNTINRSALTSNSLPLRQFYELMSQDDDAVVMFNHPGYTWGNFVEYDFYSPEADEVVNLIEIRTKAAANYEYPLALTKGWHVSPIFNEDNHQPNWGNQYENCGFALAPALTRQNIIDAFNKNRTYTSSDLTLRVYYQINGEWMGSRLDNPDKLHFNVKVSTMKSYGLGAISIVAEDGIIVYTADVGAKQEYTLEVDLPPLYDYYYIMIDYGNIWCYTAPIWIENREHLTVDDMSHELLLNNSGSNDHRVYANVTNHTKEVMTGVTVDFYLASRTGFSEPKTKPVHTVTVGSIAPGATVTVHADLPYSPSKQRVYALAKGTQNGNAYGAVKYMEISTLYFTEILPQTSQGGKADAFEFIEFYNNSDTVLDLSNYSMRYYRKAGAKAEDLEANTWLLSGTIQPHSTAVIWIVSDNNTLTVADFNAHFGTNLVEGKDIILITGAQIPHSNPVQLELLFGATVVGRAWYNWSSTVDVLADCAIAYNYPTNYTITAQVDKSRITPTPGTLAEGQVPKAVTP